MFLIIYDLPKKWDISDINKLSSYPVDIEYNRVRDKDIEKLLLYYQCINYNKLLDEIINNVVGS